MEIEKRLAVLQNTYAASVAETVNFLEKLTALDTVVAEKKARQALTAHHLNQQLGISSIEDVFRTLSEIYGCADWTVQKTADGFVATTASCKLCALSKKMGGANPCGGWCLNPMTFMIAAAGSIDAERVTVDSTLMTGDCCKVRIHTKAE
jgi:hypothetical protein